MNRGDFNAKTGEEGGGIELEGEGKNGWGKEEERRRKSKDIGVNKEGRLLVFF